MKIHLDKVEAVKKLFGNRRFFFGNEEIMGLLEDCVGDYITEDVVGEYLEK